MYEPAPICFVSIISIPSLFLVMLLELTTMTVRDVGLLVDGGSGWMIVCSLEAKCSDLPPRLRQTIKLEGHMIA